MLDNTSVKTTSDWIAMKRLTEIIFKFSKGQISGKIWGGTTKIRMKNWISDSILSIREQ